MKRPDDWCETPQIGTPITFMPCPVKLVSMDETGAVVDADGKHWRWNNGQWEAV